MAHLDISIYASSHGKYVLACGALECGTSNTVLLIGSYCHIAVGISSLYAKWRYCHGYGAPGKNSYAYFQC